ncbi:hypothetical protein [Geomicrobium sediminis]|uniref:Uncharacterized protein n=1 Tax=Geomicrobium sediminis TaxID=1347788 RepID=A0ABS2PFA4_9BACL|nr:hypothetical protein [Geomicrobium sediminis]MBM7634088.1 hypothetical protein [Geomicrobium sediminis]
MANFESKLPVWQAEGIEPNDDIKQSGYQEGMKPPAEWFNWMYNITYEALKEIHAKAETTEGSTLKKEEAIEEAHKKAMEYVSEQLEDYDEDVEWDNVLNKRYNVIDLLDNGVSGNDYPIGTSLMRLTGSDDTSYPFNYAIIRTEKLDTFRIVQQAFAFRGTTNTELYLRRFHPDNGWSNWETIDTSSQIDQKIDNALERYENALSVDTKTFVANEDQDRFNVGFALSRDDHFVQVNVNTTLLQTDQFELDGQYVVLGSGLSEGTYVEVIVYRNISRHVDGIDIAQLEAHYEDNNRHVNHSKQEYWNGSEGRANGYTDEKVTEINTKIGQVEGVIAEAQETLNSLKAEVEGLDISKEAIGLGNVLNVEQASRAELSELTREVESMAESNSDIGNTLINLQESISQMSESTGYVIGSYEGNGENNQNINVGFEPKAVIVTRVIDSGTPIVILATRAHSARSSYVTIPFQGNVFNVRNSMNMGSSTHLYIAFK